ncbi:NUDIX hydrolase [Phanerochaete sordida]|uniref:NUDIX hydrolase n=1 Tax=Phanerochaete sordida TaxID=48140 RepID=A0A9P3G702_9APHY|nr:NUDIX hydrolase [Phanerochaete sordida]
MSRTPTGSSFRTASSNDPARPQPEEGEGQQHDGAAQATRAEPEGSQPSRHRFWTGGQQPRSHRAPAQPAAAAPQRAPDAQPLSPLSSPGIPDSLFHAQDFMLGAGMVILQPATGRVVLVHDAASRTWFLPKGRKDVGESLEQAVLREAYEESGYRATLMPLYVPTNAPAPPAQRTRLPAPNTEPFYMHTQRWRGRRTPQAQGAVGGEYFVFWYVGQIAEDAVWEQGTGMPDEQGYRAHLLTRAEAMDRLGERMEGLLVQRAYELWELSVRVEEWVKKEERKARGAGSATAGDADAAGASGGVEQDDGQ